MGTVIDAVKGGVVMTAAGYRVFVPASQTGIAKGGDLAVLVGTAQKVRIIDIDKQKKRAVASISAIQREERKAAEAALRATLEVGQHFKGTVKNLTKYGAFVDIGGIDGMVHNSELSWKHIKHPSQVVSVGQEIDVYIKELDEEKSRISLGYKTEEMDDFAQFIKGHKVGDVITAKIVNMTPFGAFAEVAPGVDGLIHISQLSNERVEKPSDLLEIGQEVTAKVTEFDPEKKRISLSIRALIEQKEEPAEEAAAEEAPAEEAPVEATEE